MDVRQLAPALLAIGDLFERSNGLLNGTKAHVSVRVTATERGSFVVSLEFWQTVAEHVRALLSPEHIATVDVIVTSLLGKVTGVLGVIKLIKVFRGRRIKRRRVLESGNVEIEMPDGSTAETTEEAIRLYEDRKIREDAADSVKPLEAEGIDTLEVRRGRETLETVQKNEREAFVAAAEKPDYKTLEPTVKSSAQRAVEIVKPSFADDLVWTVSGGEGERFTAKMVDETFQGQIERGEVYFKKGDVAIVEVATRSWIVDGKVHSEHEITRVHRFEHSDGEQLILSEGQAQE